MSDSKIRIACVGAGYFAQYHIEAWTRVSNVELVAICDIDTEKAQKLADKYQVPKVYKGIETLLEDSVVDFIDIITPPSTHADLINRISQKGIHIICQKPFTRSLAEARVMVKLAHARKVSLFIHENFRFQPWYGKIKELKDQGILGGLHNVQLKLRTGDGWGDDAYLNRQPYFRKMPRLFMYETGIHYIDVFRYLHGEIVEVYAKLGTFNANIKGEDHALVVFTFTDGTTALLDANRYNESNTDDPRYTFGKITLEGRKGVIYLESDSSLFYKPLGEDPVNVDYVRSNVNFAGDCVYHAQSAMMKSYREQFDFETRAEVYLRNMVVLEAVYKSAATNQPVRV
ncbi:MAG: Gfo/Idh/MocA family oxidoreductase [Saprospiraceae bacterium]|nr:Gfo/Idh/MocA family oxidoreductase [Saprospiraceae bacterium]